MASNLPADSPPLPVSPASPRRLARLALLAFLLSFVAARITVLLIMTRRIPDLFLHIGGTHVHHLNYGILLLAGVGARLLFAQPGTRAASWIAVVYGIGLALTFDEFGMWVHLGGGYWQRASFDAICVVTAVLGLIAFVPPPRSWRARHWTGAVIAVLVTAAFFYLLAGTLRDAGVRLGPRLNRLEQEGPA